MNKIIWVIVIVVLILGGVLIFRNSPASAPIVAPVSNNGIPDDSQVFTTLPEETLHTFVVTGSKFKFDPAEIKVKLDNTVRITFKNNDGNHDWNLDEFQAKTKILKTGEEETIEFVASEKGIFEYYCSVGDHRALGMRGNLIVE